MSLEEDLKPQPALAAPPLPRALAEQLFDYSKPGLPALRYSAVGPERWPTVMAFDAVGGFTTWVNPLDRPWRIVINLGPDPSLHAHFEMSVIPPEHRCPRSIAQTLLGRGQCLRPEYARMVIVIAPGQSVTLPACFDRAIRTLERDSGDVVGGLGATLVTQAEHDGTVDRPRVHPSLLPSDAPLPKSSAPRRRA